MSEESHDYGNKGFYLAYGIIFFLLVIVTWLTVYHRNFQLEF